VVGLAKAKNELKATIVLPEKFPDIFKGLRQPWTGILLYGPPGTGKTFLAKACATENKAAFFNVSPSDIMSKYVGDSEKHVKNIFKQAKKHPRAIIFIDEIDSLVSKRSDNDNESTTRVKT
jgi:vacuolar protein-sorting-associated protein 4